MRSKVSFSIILFSLLMLFGLPQRSLAHTGGVLYLANEPSGDFEISVWVLPQLVTTAEMVHFDLLVLELAEEGQTDQEFILGADVTVKASTLDGDLIVVEGKASNTFSENPLFYEAALMLEEPGRWQIDIMVENEDGSAHATFELLVEREARVNWYMLGAAIVVVAGAAIFVLRSRPQNEDE